MTASAENKPTQPAKLEQKKYVVAFLDFLGASDKMRSPEESDKFLQQIKQIYNSTLSLVEERNKTSTINMTDIRVRIFSDNMVVAQECVPPFDIQECLNILMFSAYIQANALLEGALIRGAITAGNFYIDDTMVYGEALVRAHELESQIAIYPRIVIDRKIAETSVVPASKVLSGNLSIQDFDGEWIANFIATFAGWADRANSIKLLIGAREKILELFKIPTPDAKVQQKYDWLAIKFNELCENAEFTEQKIKMGFNKRPDPTAFYEDRYKYQPHCSDK